MRTDCIRFLVAACSRGDIEAVARAVKVGVEVDGIASKGRQTPLEAACSAGQIEVVRFLLKHGASLTIADHLPLSVAAARGQLEIVRLLLKSGADVDGRNSCIDDLTPLMRAASEAHMETAEVLIAAGADIDAENEIGDTPLNQARDYEWRYSAYNPVVDLLYMKGAGNFGSQVPLKDRPPRPDKSTVGKPHDADGEPLELSESTPPAETCDDLYKEGQAHQAMVEQLMKVVDEGEKEVQLAPLFRQHGANANLPHIEEGWTALGYAVQKGNAEILQRFLFFDADPDLGGVVSPVHEAIQLERIDILRLLLEAGADPAGENEGGLTPLEIARATGQEEVASLVQQFIENPPV